MPERGFLIFEFFCYFFRNFLARVESERNSGLKFYSLFFSLSLPVLVKNNVGKSFLKFWIFFYFIRNFLARVEYERNSGLNFFCPFLGLSHPVWAINYTGKRFFNFLKFFAIFFLEFSFPGRGWTEFGTKIFFISFSAYLISFWLKIMLEIFFNFFAIFFRIFLPRSNMNRIRD